MWRYKGRARSLSCLLKRAGLVLLVSAPAFAADLEAIPRAVVNALDRATLGSRMAGQIIAVSVREGDGVAAGDVLVQFDCRVVEAESAAAAARLSGSDVRYRSAVTLAERNAASKTDLGLAEAELAERQAEVELARLAVEGCTVRAPFDGVVTAVLAHMGESVQAGQSLAEIVNTARVDVAAIVPVELAATLAPGRRAYFETEDGGAPLPLRVEIVGTVVDPVGQTVVVRLVPEDSASALMPGRIGFLRLKD